MGRQCSKLLWFRYNAKDHEGVKGSVHEGVGA